MKFGRSSGGSRCSSRSRRRTGWCASSRRAASAVTVSDDFTPSESVIFTLTAAPTLRHPGVVAVGRRAPPKRDAGSEEGIARCPSTWTCRGAVAPVFVFFAVTLAPGRERRRRRPFLDAAARFGRAGLLEGRRRGRRRGGRGGWGRSRILRSFKSAGVCCRSRALNPVKSAGGYSKSRRSRARNPPAARDRRGGEPALKRKTQGPGRGEDGENDRHEDR